MNPLSLLSAIGQIAALFKKLLGLFERAKDRESGRTEQRAANLEAAHEQESQAKKVRRRARERVDNVSDDELRDAHFRD